MKSTIAMFFTLASFSMIAFVSIQTGAAKAYVLQVAQEDPRDNLKKAIEELSKKLEENPNDRDLLKRRGDFYEAIGKYPEAVKDYSKLIALNPDYADVFHSRGAIYWLHLDNPELARADFNSELKIHDKKIELNFEDAASYKARAFVQSWYFKNNEKAVEDYTMVLLFQPNDTYSRMQRSSLYKELGRVGESLGDIDLVVSHYSALITKDAGDTNSLGRRAQIFIEIKRYSDALADYTSLIKLEPEDTEHYEHRAKVNSLLNKPLDAIADYTALIKIDPNNSWCYKNRAEIFLKLKKYPEALADLNIGIKLRPKDAFNFIARGDVYKAMDKKLLAMADYIEANSLDPKNFPITDYVRIEDLTSQEERDFYNSKFLERYNKAIDAEPKEISHYKVRAKFYASDAKTYSKAIEDYTKILELEPSNENALDEKLRLLLELKKLPETVIFLNKILELNFENEHLFNERNKCLKELKRYPEIIEHLTAKIAKEHDIEGNLLERAAIYKEMRNFHKAKDDYKAILQIHDLGISKEPGDADLYFSRAEFLQKYFRNHELALRDFTKAVNLVPQKVKYLEARAKYYESCCNYKAAIEEYTKIIQISPKNVVYLDSRARLYTFIWDFSSAINDYNLILQLEPKNLDTYGERASVYRYWNKPELAKADFKKVLDFHDAKIAANPKDAGAYAGRMRFLYYPMSAYEEAGRDYLKVQELNPSNSLGYTEKSLEIRVPMLAKKIIDSHPKDADEYVHRAEAYLKFKKYAEALADYDKAISLDPDKISVFESRAELLQKTGKQDEAKAEYLKILKMVDEKIKTLDDEIYCEDYGRISNDSDSYLYTQRASIYQKLNKIPEAFADYTKAIKLSPMSYSFRGEFNLKLERYQDTIADFTKALKLMPIDPLASHNRGLALLKLNKPHEALEDFNRAIIVVGHIGEWYQNRSLAYRALGKIKEADADLATANKLLSEE
jgi:tetratricopeptide (TPR) repeat protein